MRLMIYIRRLEKKEETENNCWLFGKCGNIEMLCKSLFHFRDPLLHCHHVSDITGGNCFDVRLFHRCK